MHLCITMTPLHSLYQASSPEPYSLAAASSYMYEPNNLVPLM